MHSIMTVFVKETLDNLRDRRTMMSALVFGPLFGPLIFGLIISIALNSQIDNQDELIEIPILGAEHAPNLVSFIEQNNVSLKRLPAGSDVEELITEREYALILRIDEDFGRHFREGVPATVATIADESNRKVQKPMVRIRALLEGYGHKTAAMRMQARGISHTVTQPLVIDSIDVSTPASRAISIIGVITYFLIFSVLMGGMYLAIDITAGERERGSLESLLCVPVSRTRLVLGKILATAAFMSISLAITLIAFLISLSWLPLERIDMVANFPPTVAFKTFLIMLPFVAFGAGFMTIIATFSKTYKEAQSYLSLSMILPTVPIMLAVFATLKPSLPMMMIPSLSQHLLVTELVKGLPLDPLAVVVSVLSTLAVAAVLVLLSVYRYYQESLLV